MSLHARARLCCVGWLVAVACAGPVPGGSRPGDTAAPGSSGRGIPFGPATAEQVQRGRQLVLARDCGACHGGGTDPTATAWLAGRPGPAPFDSVGPFKMWPANLTPDAQTGTGRYSARQLFNALRYGLRPATTPDVQVTSAVPGQGNHPARPDYLSPSMPWMYWRFMTDQELWDIAAYLQHGVRPVRQRVPSSGSPPDRWASALSADKIGTHVLPPFPTNNEELRQPDRREEILRGRTLVASTACSACHGGAAHSAQAGWLAGAGSAPGAPFDEFQIGPFRTRPRNLTPDNTTGMGRFSERQIFNALRYGLRPGETPDVEITSSVPGQGNFPRNPKYLAPPMPWPAWRHLTDRQLRDMAAYLKHGVKPVRNRVADSEGPPDFWASQYTPEKLGTYPAPAFPTAREAFRP